MFAQKTILPAVFLFGAVIVSAQSSGSGPAVSRPVWFSAGATFSGVPMPMAPITGAPFSGTREYEHTQTLADGTHISQKNIVQRIWRDADGRMRTERPMGRAPNAASLPDIVEITDPVVGYRYTLDAQNKIAHRMVIPQRPLPPPPPLASGQNQSNRMATGAFGTMGAMIPPPGGGTGIIFGSSSGAAQAANTTAAQAARQHKFNREPLGTKSIDGVTADGNRMTITVPVGEQGNDRPISTVTETWFSPDLREIIESTSSDPRSGESITRLTGIDRNNPDPALFQIPADYQIVDEQGAFSINYSRPQ